MPSIQQNDLKFLKKTIKLAEESFCLRKRVAAMIVKNGKILAACTNDPLPAYDCSIIGCIRDEMKIPHGHRREICYGICAEMYALAKIVQSGQNAKGSTIYVTIRPCRVCEGIISQSGIKRVVYASEYPSVIPHIDTLRDHNIEVVHIPIELKPKQMEQKMSVEKTAKILPKNLGFISPPAKK
ncbi:hypothetical protein HYV57_04795 [Candidatus Peregrinibacteria bacterium]|nr:hypothetical protein [Candidatus Peregrinibacteria bacterium]